MARRAGEARRKKALGYLLNGLGLRFQWGFTIYSIGDPEIPGYR